MTRGNLEDVEIMGTQHAGIPVRRSAPPLGGT